VDAVERPRAERACLHAAGGLDDQGFRLPFLPFEIARPTAGHGGER
jgi:hypothetical protein